jgi:hypothetical protein
MMLVLLVNLWARVNIGISMYIRCDGSRFRNCYALTVLSGFRCLQYFDVNADQLQPALDRFAQFFAAPLFSESATGRELNAIDSEHAKNINSDGFRLHQVGLVV